MRRSMEGKPRNSWRTYVSIFTVKLCVCVASLLCVALTTPNSGAAGSVIRHSTPDEEDAIPDGLQRLSIQNEEGEYFAKFPSNGDLIPDDYKIVVKLDMPPDATLDPIHISLLRQVLAQEIGVSKSSVQVSQEDVTMKSAVTEARIWSMFEKEIWKSWQLPFLMISCLLLVLLLVIGVVFICFRQQIYKKPIEKEPKKHVCLFPVVKPVVDHTNSVQPEPSEIYLSENNFQVLKHPIRIRAKGLLERRGSNASLTIDLNPSLESLTTCSISRNNNEDYLLSAGNRMTRKQLCNSIKDSKALHSEFWEIPMNHPERVEIAGFGMKNRYKTILPNEHSRVKLEEMNNDPLTTYINANYAKGYDGEEKYYIATQGPMFHTICDFWRMVWQERVCTIVMITKLREKNKIKCEPYLPDGTCKYGDIEVSINEVIHRDGYVVRHLLLRKGNQFLEVNHFWYTSWPDHRTPSNPQQLLTMALEVEAGRVDNDNRPKGPVLVHCSAGIGRTGCFIAIAIGMRQLIEENMVDVLGIVCVMRQDRGGMIQTAEQYEFVHRALCLFEQSLPDQPTE